MENIIYNELLYRGFSVDVGTVETIAKDKAGKSIRKQYEVDFVANDSDSRYYIQSAYSIPNEEKLIQETNSFAHLNDSFKRILIVNDNVTPHYDEKGIFIISLFDFLLNSELMMTG